MIDSHQSLMDTFSTGFPISDSLMRRAGHIKQHSCLTGRQAAWNTNSLPSHTDWSNDSSGLNIQIQEKCCLFERFELWHLPSDFLNTELVGGQLVVLSDS